MDVRHGAAGSRRAGLAIVIVILVLASLLVLCTPFLLSSRNADSASRQLFDRGEARIALDTASRHGRSRLAGSHPGAVETAAGFETVDETPWYDSLDEVTVDNRFDEAFYDANDPTGVMWDLDVEDLSGLVDVNSAPPQVFANLMGLSSRIPRPLEEEATDLRVTPLDELVAPGVLVIDGEYLWTPRTDGGDFVDVERGFGARYDGDNRPLPGPRPPSSHPAGAVVLDQRAFAPALWRLEDPEPRLRRFDAAEQLADASQLCWVSALTGTPGLGAEPLRRLRAHSSVFAGAASGRTWQRPTRLTTPIVAEETGVISVDSPRWFNEGSTVRISDGLNTELALVQRIVGQGRLELDRPLVNDYEAWETEVRVLARRPVNVNTASKELLELLFLNLQVRGRNERIVTTEARALAEVVVESRPFTGHEDFLRRIVLPAAGLEKLPPDAPVVPDVFAQGGDGFITAVDAFALYTNALNANDLTLSFSTMPLCYTSRDTYRLSLRSVVNAKSGVERANALREEVLHVVPQRDLWSIWTLQEQLDESLRLDREAPWWATGPRATTRYDFTTVPPSRLWPHMGSANGQRWLPGVVADPKLLNSPEPPVAEHVFADREELGWAQLWPHRLEETQPIQGRVLHFDQETRDPEGRYLPDEVIKRPTDDTLLQWTDASEPFLRPLYLSLWFRPRALTNATLLDVGGANLPDVDRILLLVENGDLVLRVLDGFGDHPATTLEERGELRYPIGQGPGPGLPLDVWSHIAIDVRGNRPDQMTMLVNGLSHGVTSPGASELVASAGPGSGTLAVESLVGFRDQGCLRIGEELIEYTLDGSGAVSALRQTQGRLAGFGGRNARTRWTHEKPDMSTAVAGQPLNLNGIDLSHAGSSTVEQYGYSLPLETNVPFGGAVTNDDIGLFRVARLVGVEGGDTPAGDSVIVTSAAANGAPFSFTLGFGLKGSSSQATGLLLESADTPGDPNPEFMEAFDAGGGYAALVQIDYRAFTVETSDDGAQLGGVEVIRYAGKQGNMLLLAARGDSVPELPNYTGLGSPADGPGGVRAFVAQWDPQVMFDAGGGQVEQPAINLMKRQTFVVPISVTAPGATNLSFLEPIGGRSEFAQFTHVDDAELTEWVRYDTIVATGGHLVRDALDALVAIELNLVGLTPPEVPTPLEPPGPGGPGSGGGPGGGKSAAAATAPAPAAAAPAASAAPATAQSVGTTSWLPVLGADQLTDFPVSRSVSDGMQFRGVFGTFAHRHPSGTQILPVFQVRDGSSPADSGADGGQPGRLDPVFLVNDDPPDDLGWSGVVHWAHRPADMHFVRAWEQTDESTLSVQPSSAAPAIVPHFSEVGSSTVFPPSQLVYIALQRGAGAPVPRTQVAASANAVADSRRLARIVCFPSGELPRVVLDAGIGVDRSGGAIPSALVDEIVFGDTVGTQPGGVYATSETRGAAAVLASEFGPGVVNSVLVFPNSVRTSMERIPLTSNEVLSTWPQDAGLVRIGREILCYSNLDANTGSITIAPGGRGLLGTQAQHHEAGEPLHLLEHFQVSVLGAGVGQGDSALVVEDRTGFPEEGTVLIDQELVHYTRVRGTTLEMPRLSEEPGAMDRGGGGVFRGRYGTLPADHALGTPVILFPIRYWDRWQAEADGPELSYFGLSKDEPGAFWREMFFLTEDASLGGSRIGVLVRTDPDVPWDANPDETEGLEVLYPDDLRNEFAALGGQSDRIEWRVFVDYTPGAFDVTTGQQHGWRQTPRFDALGVRYFAPTVKLRSVEE